MALFSVAWTHNLIARIMLVEELCAAFKLVFVTKGHLRKSDLFWKKFSKSLEIRLSELRC